MTVVRPSLERVVVAAVFTTVGALVAAVGLRGLGAPWWAAGIAVVLLAAVVGAWLVRRLPAALDGRRRRRPVACALWAVLALLAVAQTARLSTFMADPGRPQHSLQPWHQWQVQHCCLTAYTEATRFARAGQANIYQ